MKFTRSKYFEALTFEGVISFIFNCLQSVIADNAFGFLYLTIFSANLSSGNIAIISIVIIFLAIYLIGGIPLWGYLMEKTQNRYNYLLQRDALRYFLNSSRENSTSAHSGEILTVLHHDCEEVSRLISWDLVVLFQAILSGIVSICVIGNASVFLLLSLILVGALPVLYNAIIAKNIKAVSVKTREVLGKRNIKFTELINNVIIIRIHGLSTRFEKQIIKLNNDVLQLRNQQSKMQVLSNSLSHFIYEGVFKAVAIIVGLQLVSDNEITFGQLVLIVSMLTGLQFILSYIGSYIKNIQSILVSRDKIDEIITNPRSIQSEQKRGDIYSIKFCNASYRYGNATSWVISDVTIELNFPGNYLLLGDNGSGKSTIMKLMMGLYVPEEGRCLINNSLIHGMNGDCWYLSQNVALYQDSIINNIKLGDETITNDMINQSLKCVELFDDVVKLPDKLHTIIREEGRNLSQGQRSRLALARILVRRPEILLLDEFEANIDQNTANNIICNIREEFPRTSIVAISHIARTGIYSGFNRIAVKNQKMFHLN